MRRVLVLVGVVLLNVALALAMQKLAPSKPLRSDRAEYEYTARHPFAPNCPNSIYCYRVAVPLLLNAIPGGWETKWRGYQLSANAAAGTTVALAAYQLMPVMVWPILATIIVQTSYGFTFTAYDPYSADPMVFFIAAVLFLCWVRNRPGAAMMIAVGGVFVKETVALIAVSMSIAALFDRHRPFRSTWMQQGALATAVLLGFHYVMDTFNGWHTFHPQALNMSGGWLAVWWKNNPSLWRKLYIVFSSFGFAWLFAFAGLFVAARELRRLAFGAAVAMLALIYVQTPERALSNAFFIVVPLAVTWLYGASPVVAFAAAITNGLVTAKLGLSSAALPSTAWLLIPAAIAAVATFIVRRPVPVEEEEPDRGDPFLQINTAPPGE